ncbi:hypothetical protein [Haliscomenobacter sp.]|uniref:hypothetical protein n=1 Tax=Haliscomenobacter sp. TaxID=2717303 RepID=UPI003593ED36
MKNPWIKLATFTLSGFELHPPENYEYPKNQKTGKELPYCCKFHTKAYEGIQEWFTKFPDCCDTHRELKDNPQFSKSQYENIANKIIKQISFTEHIVATKINEIDWFEDITDFIIANLESLGHPNIGWDRYLSILEYRLRDKKWLKTKNIPLYKSLTLLEYTQKEFRAASADEQDSFDLDLLYETYGKWLAIFPFEISYFEHLKASFERRIPFLKGEPQKNRYTGLSRVKGHTKSSLVQVLLTITNELLVNINGLKLYEKGKISNIQHAEIEILNAHRRQNLKKGYIHDSSEEERQFHAIIKEWLNDEQIYLSELRRIIAEPPGTKIYNINNIDNANFS